MLGSVGSARTESGAMTKQRVFALALSTLSTWGLVVALLYVIA
jgi:hypothetical protein